MYTVTITSGFFLFNRHGKRLVLRWDGVRAGRAARGDWAGAAKTRLVAARPVLCSSENSAEFAEFLLQVGYVCRILFCFGY